MNQIELQVLLVFLVIIFFICPLIVILLNYLQSTNEYILFEDD